MIQFNLLPDIKMQYVKAQRNKRTVVAISTLVGAAALFLLILMFLVVNVFQKKHLSDVNKDISTYSSQLQNTKDLSKILTIQNQLESLPALHAKKPVTSLLFKYLGQIVPAQVTISSTSVDFTQDTLAFTGQADSVARINTFVDTLKFTTYSTSDGSVTNKNAFSNVVLSNFSVGTGTDSSSGYTVNFNFSPDIFDSSKNVTLTVPPNKITTRSETEKPSDLFQTAPTKTSP